MLAEILGLIPRDEVVQRSNHIRQESVVFACDGRGKNSILMSKKVGIIDIESGEAIEAHATDLGDVVFVCGRNSARDGQC